MATYSSFRPQTQNLVISGDTTLGDASGDTLTINASTASIPNNLNIDSGTLFIDAANDRIGIGTSSPATRLEAYVGADVNADNINLNVLTLTGIDNTGGYYYANQGAGVAFRSGFVAGNTRGPEIMGAIYGANSAPESVVNGQLTFHTRTSGSVTEKMRIDSNGSVLVGTTATVNPSAITPQVCLEGLTNNTSTVCFARNSNDIGAPNLYFAKSRGTTLGSKTVVQNGDFLGIIGAVGADGSDFDSTAAEIRFTVDGTPGANDMPGRIEFRTTADGAASATERMRITSAGNVGIGTSSPSRSLAVNGTFIAAPSVYLGDATAGDNARLGARQVTSGALAASFTGNTNLQGTAQFNRLVYAYPVVSLGTKLIIPFVNQGALNSTTICRIMGHSARYNSNTPLGFTINFAVGHLTALYNLASWGGGGNYSSIAINGMNVEITFTTAYTAANSNGIYLTLEYMTNNFGLSIDLANIRMN